LVEPVKTLFLGAKMPPSPVENVCRMLSQMVRFPPAFAGPEGVMKFPDGLNGGVPPKKPPPPPPNPPVKIELRPPPDNPGTAPPTPIAPAIRLKISLVSSSLSTTGRAIGLFVLDISEPSPGNNLSTKLFVIFVRKLR
jgi:hypothetical protein